MESDTSPLMPARTVLTQTQSPVSALRMLRSSLRCEERRVSYWRRLLQGRLDLITGGEAGRPAPLDTLAGHGVPAQRPERPPAGLVDELRTDPLAEAERLWREPVPWQDPAGLSDHEAELHRLERELSAYRRLLHERIDACTHELIGRYQHDLAAVPGLAVLGDERDEAAVYPAF